MIALDARMVGHSGIGTYIRGLLSGFGPERLRQLVLIGDPAKLSTYGCRVEPAFEPIYGAREQWAMPRRLKRLAPRLFHSPHYNIPAAYGGPLVATVHDLNHLLFPQFSRSRLARLYARMMLPALYKRARRILADSGNTRNDLLRFGAPEEKLRVVRLGVEERFRPAGAEAKTDAASRFGLKPRFFLYLGNVRPIKNIDRLLEAYALLRGRRSDAPPLVLAGRQDMAVPSGGGVRCIGPVPSELLPALYSAAEAFVFPSLYEGFGLPPLEAMACGCPVVASTAGSLPEVLGDAAAAVDPADARGLSDAMEKVWRDPGFRDGLIRKGLERAKAFTWKKAADETWAVYEEAMR